MISNEDIWGVCVGFCIEEWLVAVNSKWLLGIRTADLKVFRLRKYGGLIHNPEKLPIVQVSVSDSSRWENVSISLVDIL